MSEWNNIETAPRDGTRIWVFIPGAVIPQRKGKRFRNTASRQMSVFWMENPGEGNGHELSDHAKELVEKHGGFWTGQSIGRRPTTCMPTHWMPLPAPPGDT